MTSRNFTWTHVLKEAAAYHRGKARYRDVLRNAEANRQTGYIGACLGAPAPEPRVELISVLASISGREAVRGELDFSTWPVRSQSYG